MAGVVVELLASPERTRSYEPGDFVLLTDVALYRAIYLAGRPPETECIVLFSFPRDPETVFGFRHRVFDTSDPPRKWPNGKNINNDPDTGATMFCTYFEEDLETRGLEEHRVAPSSADPTWIS